MFDFPWTPLSLALLNREIASCCYPEVKLSSLSYALLPSTKIQIHNLDFQASLKAVLELDSSYPFVSNIEVSLTQQPICNLRVTPIGDSSLNGVDLGSIPFINDWIQDAIKTGLAAYVAPRFISLNLKELFHRYDTLLC